MRFTVLYNYLTGLALWNLRRELVLTVSVNHLTRHDKIDVSRNEFSALDKTSQEAIAVWDLS